MLPFNDHMSLYERLLNVAFLAYERLLLDYYYLPGQEQLYKEFFPGNKRCFYEMRRNASLVLINQHVSLSFPRPYSPNMIEVGGMHIDGKLSPLPEKIERFINESEHGSIYFSMGSNLKSKDLPPAKDIFKYLNLINTFYINIFLKKILIFYFCFLSFSKYAFINSKEVNDLFNIKFIWYLHMIGLLIFEQFFRFNLDYNLNLVSFLFQARWL